MSFIPQIIIAEIDYIKPNPRNPRTNYATKTEDMQRIIKEKGWEVPITCYKSDEFYTILSGHRRWYAAKQLSFKEIPVYLVEAPKSIEEEQERLGSIQGGKSDWSVYEWAKHTYEMWIDWDKCSFQQLALKLNKSTSFVSTRVQVFRYFPHSEIGEHLMNGKFSISVLFNLMKWLESLARLKPEIVEQYKLDVVRSTMLQKIEKKLVGILDLKTDTFIREANDEQIKKFLKNPDAKLELSEYSKKYRGKSKVRTYIEEIKNLGVIFEQVNFLEFKEDNNKLMKEVDVCLLTIQELKNDLERYITSDIV
ncbi:ParB/RepB/Spo0J family partition protein [Paenibacillus aceti]|uniref:ParB-like N-terminal domain-containing protein n=1 Tax=Paenibacillus aceti TaxID=1820010 RepID=A0ABQ1W6K4_9BACL|nr:ParB N-terminal domain-containing protein [Paenibacillus aceti]GGG17602.1 hypothetical protein GCM10010913_44620 [Paenibacillus aceti]